MLRDSERQRYDAEERLDSALQENRRLREKIEALSTTAAPAAATGRALVDRGTSTWGACMDDIPNEMLARIFAFLPGEDWFSTAPRVCTRWRRVVLATPLSPAASIVSAGALSG